LEYVVCKAKFRKLYTKEVCFSIADVSPLKTPNPEPEDDEGVSEDQFEMKPMSNSSSVELVSAADTDDACSDHTYVRQRMESLELKPGEILEVLSL